MSQQDESFDVIIIGGGPAGLTAAMYSSWLGLRTVVLEAGVAAGGKAWQAARIENFPGFEEGIDGSELAAKMSRQAKRHGASINTSEEVVGLDIESDIKRVTTRKRTYEASAVIVCTGTQRKKLQVPGETDFLGRGVSYCAVCDGTFFKDSAVAVVGAGREAVADTLFLADIANSVTLVTHEKGLDIEGEMKKLQGKRNVEIIEGQLVSIVGEKVVKSIKILEADSQQEIEKEVKGVFVALGGVPTTEIVKKAGISTDRNGCLIVDRLQRTNVEGVFAAGDCTCGGMQVVTAAGEGAMAAMKASAHVRRIRAKK